MKNLFLFACAATLFAACNPSADGEKAKEKAAPAEKSQQILKAEQIHEEAIALYAETKGKVAKMRAEYDEEMANLGGGLPQDEMILKERWGMLLKRFESELQQWNDELIEVPGHAHTHADGEHHHHDHNHEQDSILEGLSDDDHLNIQNEQLMVMQALTARVDDAIANKDL